MKNILVSALGAKSEIIEETIGLFNYTEVLDFYSKKESVQQIRTELFKIDELWLVSTDQVHTDKGNSAFENFEYIVKCCEKYGAKIRMFVLKNISDIINESDAKSFHDLLLRVVSYAHQKKKDGKLYLSLACGRKTMSTDMQDAAYCFGCDMMIHVLGDNPQTAQPLLLGKMQRNESLKMQEQCFADDNYLLCEPETDYLNIIENQKKQAQHFYTSYYLNEKETRSNFHILYTLPPSKIEQLKNERLGIDKKREVKELQWIKRLPKTDLHCHLGGVLSPNDILFVAKENEYFDEEVADNNRPYKNWVEKELPKLKLELKDLKDACNKLSKKFNVPRSCILSPYIRNFICLGEHELTSYIYGDYCDETKFCGIGIDKYEQLGDIQGSSLLDCTTSISATLELFLQKCIKENVKYVEIRCSPLNYSKTSELPASMLVLMICDLLERVSKKIQTSLIFIVSRHREDMTAQYIELVKQLKDVDLFKKFFRGFDLAGNEGAKAPEELRSSFLEIMKECYNITIHAGEDQPVNNIWEAVYHLNAERIGHGLTLQDNEDLLNKFLQRGIGIEMCPSSNYQIVGYRDNYYPQETGGFKVYPLKKYLDKELLVSVNTDDPGISLTDMTHELHKAARMTEGGLSKWEILQLVCNGFRTAFYPYERKKELMRMAENCIGELIKQDKL